jgi:CBS domain-containing protein
MIAMVNFFAKDIMIRDVYVIEVGNKIALARLKMMRHGIGGLPVVDKKGKVVGMITLRDIDLAGTDVSNLPVEDLMTTNLVKGKVDTTTKEIVELMIKTGIQRIPIVDEKGKLLGLITQTSIIKSAIAHNLF